MWTDAEVQEEHDNLLKQKEQLSANLHYIEGVIAAMELLTKPKVVKKEVKETLPLQGPQATKS